jgi:Leucine-rich repeat (LRR) protein
MTFKLENGEYIAQYARDSISNLALKGSGHFDDPVLNLSLLSYLTTLSITNISIHKLFNLNLTQLTQLSLIFDIASDWTDLTISKFANGGLSIFPGVIELKLVNCLSRALLDNCPSVSSLDLSGNEKLDHVSSVVNCLTELTSLDMGDNGIESLSGLSCDLSGRIADLSRITVLRISRNELENLEGIERLNSLVFLDVSDNKIEITQEIGRLANLAHVSEIVIRGNPLTNLVLHWLVSNIFRTIIESTYFNTSKLGP